MSFLNAKVNVQMKEKILGLITISYYNFSLTFYCDELPDHLKCECSPNYHFGI